MDKGERLLKIFFEAILIIAFFFILCAFFEITYFLLIIVSVFVIHSIMWIFNDHFWGLISDVGTVPSLSKEKLILYCNRIYKITKSSKSIIAILVFGSISRKEIHDQSDIDIRIIRRPGFTNLISAYFLCMKLRFDAFIHVIPFDLFLGDDMMFLNKLSRNELPVVIHDFTGSVGDIYSVTIPFSATSPSDFYQDEK
jgi:predicted nucleotidyltransferase